MKSKSNITTVTLDNGLVVKLKEMHSVPLISHWVWYRVGSRDELPGKTGISHWVEHMQFKGTKRFPANVMDKTISREGGVWNAFTYLDWTTFFETLHADKIELAFMLESDRMQHSLFKPKEVEAERTVIISELEGNENEPAYRLSKSVQQAAFETHPYRIETIGELADLRAITRNDLFNHYQTYYCPANVIIGLAGDFETAKIVEKLNKFYGKIPPGNPSPHPAKREKSLDSEKRLELKGPGETIFMEVAYRAPEASHPDFHAFTVLDSLLTGPTSLNMFGGGSISNKTCRLYRKLVEKRLAVGVGGGLQGTIDPFLYIISMTLPPNGKPERALRAVDNEIERIQNDLVKPEEITRAVKQAKALFAYGSENITNQAFWLGFAEMFDSYNWFVEYVDRLEKVTPTDIRDVAQKYCQRETRVIGSYIPSLAGEGK